MNPPGWLPRRGLKKSKFGLALSGGGLRGLAHIGVLQALEDEGIKPDLIAGVSMGGTVGALYACGYSPAEMKRTLTKIDWSDLFIDQPSRRTLFLNRKRSHGRHLLQIRFQHWKPYIPAGIGSGQKISLLLDDLLMKGIYHPAPDFDHLKYPLRVPAVDLFSGQLVTYDRGDLGEVLRGSMAFPLIFTPVKTKEHTLVDGGALENIPVATVKAMGADKVLAVDIASPLLKDVSEPWEIANQITSIMIADKRSKALEGADLVLQPAPDSISSFDFAAAESLPDMGYQSTLAAMDTIKALMKTAASAPEDEIIPRAVIYKFTDNLAIEPNEAGKIRPGEAVTRTQIKRTLAEWYEKYELEDAAADFIRDTLFVSLTQPPAFWHITVKGNQAIPDSIIKAVIKSQIGKPISYRQGVTDKERIIKLYRDKGLALAEITKTELIGGSLYLTIDEGKVTSLEVEGGRRSALMELRLQPGQLFDWNRVKKGLNRLYGSDIYESARVKTVKTPQGHKIVLCLDRRPFPLIRIGGRYDTERGGSGFAEFIQEDLFGSGTAINALAAPGEKDTKISAALSADRILGTYVLFTAGLYHQINEYATFDKKHKRQPGYRYERNWTGFSLGQHLYRWGLLSASMKLERAFSDHTSDAAEQELATIVFESAIDTYDRYPFPRTGQSLHLSFQTAGEIIPGEVKYTKFAGEFQRWTPLVKRWSLNIRLKGGYAEPTVPTYEKFALGGLSDFAGLHEREIIGNQLFGGSIGLRFDLLSRFLAEAFVSVRYDFAQIVDGADELEFKQGFFRQGILASFALNTLLGPVELAYGYTPKYKEVPDNGLVFFSLGHDF